jgi:phage anti-repressor protein
MQKEFNLELNENGFVSSRGIHEFLGLKKQYSTWIKTWIKNTKYKENKDFYPYREESSGGRPSQDFFVNESMAMTLVMMSDAKFADEFRDYLMGLFKQKRDLELITPEQAVFANKVIRCLKYIEYQKEAKNLHQKHFLKGRTPYDFLFAEFNIHRNNIIGIDKNEIERLVNEYILKHEHPVKNTSIIGRINEIDPSEALRIACMDLLLGNDTDVDTANKFASLVKKMAKLEDVKTLKKNETDLFHTKDENAKIDKLNNDIKKLKD